MSIENLRAYLAGVVLAIGATPVLAVVGIGTYQDPVTREVTGAIERDWQEGVVLHEPTGNYLLTYKDAYGFYNQIVYEPATKIAPRTKAKYKKLDSNLMDFEYKIHNEASARQGIRGIRAIVSRTDPPLSYSPIGPEGWLGISSPDKRTGTTRLGWHAKVAEGGKAIAPGSTATGFQVLSPDLPGVVIMELRGDSAPAVWYGGVPDISSPIGQQIETLRRNDFVPRLVVAPKVGVPSPYNAASVLRNLRAHLVDDLVAMNLVDDTLAMKLASLIEAAAQAAELGNDKVTASAIQDVRKVLLSEHTNLDAPGPDDEFDPPAGSGGRSIDKIAAKVLDFDLTYVRKRLKAE